MTCDTCYKEIVDSAVLALEKGGTLLYPTDTIWGIGCDAANRSAVEKIYALKKRDHSKSMLILCEDLDMVERFVGRVGESAAGMLLSEERPTTVILPMELTVLADNLAAIDGTIGVRIPRFAFCQDLLHAFGRPIVSTSANLSGHPSPQCHSDIDVELLSRIDYCVPSGFENSSCGVSSRIVKFDASGDLTVLRQ